MPRKGIHGEYLPTPAEIERWKIKLRRERQAKEFKQAIEKPDIFPEDDEDDEVPTLPIENPTTVRRPRKVVRKLRIEIVDES